ncbi:ribonuclease R [Hyalangium sp.]|uniref:ribonuclease R n=1 Tax=Hyalangium sp. TaxID=2028555 RepID=UPI002D440700|nr:ribonuclease R [Hyalangium sp.]HYI01781.1 ribonuclease R [Hyalangium sp.]
MNLSPEQLKQFLADADHPLGVKELLRLAGLHAGQQTALKRALRELVRQGHILKEGKRFLLQERHGERTEDAEPVRRKGPMSTRPESVQLEGILHIHRDGYGFVHPLSGLGENVFLPPADASRALDNDRVIVEVMGRPGRLEGRLVRVVQRRRELVVGTYVEQGGRHAFVQPSDPSLQGSIRVPPTQMARDGDMVKVRLGVGSRMLGPGEGLFGEVAGSLGRPGDPSVEVLSIAYGQGFNDEFPPEVMDEADRVSPQVSDEEARGEERRDLRSMPLITIDGEDARDFDDAVYVEPQGSGWRLVVAIADVTQYVREGIALDVEALRRATSVYLPDRVLPMLPERLSNGICSLRPEEDRLCMVADMVFDARAHLRSYELYPGVMRSVARCTYNEVQDVLDGKDVPHRNGLRPLFERLLEVSRALRKMRKERGAIDFDLPEHKVVMGEEGFPERMEQRERKESHRLIEECMLAANEAVAKFFQDEGLPTVYRFHGEPDEQKLAAFATLAQAYGFKLRFEDGVSSKELDAFISQLEGHPEQRALNQLLLRSMMQAVYSASQVGHYGLAAEHYLHFTSPIRRYPDLLVHRLLKAHWARRGKKPSQALLEREEAQLEEMAEQSSERERAAMQVEREVVAFYATLLMKDRVGEEFDATVSGLAEFGFFAELDTEHVEGLVKLESIGFGGKLDKTLHALVFPDGRRIRVGLKCRVRLASVSPERRQIDFEPLEIEGKAVVRGERPLGPGRAGWQPSLRSQEPPGRERSKRPGRRLGQWRPDEAEPQLGAVQRESGARRGRREETRQDAPRSVGRGPESRQEAPRGEEKRRRFIREGQREEAAPSKADRRSWKEQPGSEKSEALRRPSSREEAPEQAGGARGKRFVVRPAARAEHESRAELSAKPWRPEQPPLAEDDPLAAFMADAPPLAPPPAVDRLRALAARSGRRSGERLQAEVPGPMRERQSREPRELRPPREDAPSHKRTSRAAPAGKRKSAPGGGKPPKSRGKFKPGRRKR